MTQKKLQKINIVYLYKESIDSYGDVGNLEVLKRRAEIRNIKVNVLEIGVRDKINLSTFRKADIVLAGGDSDVGEKNVYNDLIKNKSPYLKEFVQKNGFGLFVGGFYQLLGNYYKTKGGITLEGCGLFDVYTEYPWEAGDVYCFGNSVSRLSEKILNDPSFINNNYIGEYVVGFQNHIGQTHTAEREVSFATVQKGFGNNIYGRSEGALYNNAIGTYMYGPVLARNPHLADYLISKITGIEKLSKLDDYLVTSAHNTALGFKV